MKCVLAFFLVFAASAYGQTVVFVDDSADGVHDLYAKRKGEVTLGCTGPKWKSDVDRGHLGPMQLNGYLVNSIEIDCGYDGVSCHPTECFYYGTISKSQFFVAPALPPGVHVLGNPQ
jgi:hypothetical protein